MPDGGLAVVMPVRNGGPYFAIAVQSILAQTYRDFEFVIVDDGSTDDTADRATRLAQGDGRVKLIQQGPEGVAAATNRGVRSTTAALIARMDADDVALPHRFAEQMRFLRDHRDIAAVGSYVQLVDERGAGTRIGRFPTDAVSISRRLLLKNQFCQPTMMFRRAAFDAVGGYDPRMTFAEDHALWLAMAGRRLQLTNMPLVLLQYRDHPMQATDRRNRPSTYLFSIVGVTNAVLARNGIETLEPREPGRFDFELASRRIEQALAVVSDRRERQALYYQIARMLRLYRDRPGMARLAALVRPHALRDLNLRYFLRELAYRFA